MIASSVWASQAPCSPQRSALSGRFAIDPRRRFARQSSPKFSQYERLFGNNVGFLSNKVGHPDMNGNMSISVQVFAETHFFSEQLYFTFCWVPPEKSTHSLSPYIASRPLICWPYLSPWSLRLEPATLTAECSARTSLPPGFAPERLSVLTRRKNFKARF